MTHRTALLTFFSIFSFANVALAQMPQLDSIKIDEDSSILLCYGSFSTDSTATVHISDTSLGILSQTDTLIRAVLPLKGHGASGPVSIEIKGQQSESKLITYLHFSISIYWLYYASDGGDEQANYTDNVNLRGDLESLLSSNNSISLTPSRISTYSHSAGGYNGIHGSTYSGPVFDSTGICSSLYTISFDHSSDSFQIEHPCFSECCFYPCGPIPFSRSLAIGPYIYGSPAPDCLLNPIDPPFDFMGSSGSGWNETAPTEFPPPSTDVVKMTGFEPIAIEFSIVPALVNNSVAISSPYQNGSLNIFNLLGQPFYSSHDLNANTISLDTRSWPNGTYVAVYTAEHTSATAKFLVQH